MRHAIYCPKCSNPSEEGFVLDQTYGANLQATWVEGPPTRSVWTGVRMKGRKRVPVVTFRCVSCGYLESYAGCQPNERTNHR